MPATIRLSDLRLDPARDEVAISARVDSRRMGWRGERLWLRVPADLAPDRPHADPFAVALLLPAMAAGLDLIVHAPVSPSLAANLAKVQGLLVDWNWRNPWARLRPVRVQALGAQTASAGPAATGLFFTGGVDSLYSLIRAERDTGRRVDALLFVHGFDVPLGATAQAALVVSHLAGAAGSAGLRLITAQTNLRQFTDPALCWDMAHGAGLAFVGHALGAGFDRWLISSSDAHVKRFVSGTTRELDALWSREGLTFETVGAGIDRQRKLAALAGEAVARRHLIVCWQPRSGAANCGRCAKCVSTMLQLLVLDALDSFETLPHHVHAALLSAESILTEPVRLMVWEMLLHRLRARPEWTPLARGVAQLIERTHRAERRPALAALGTREGRRLAAAWLRRGAEPRLPVAIRRRLLAWHRRAI